MHRKGGIRECYLPSRGRTRLPTRIRALIYICMLNFNMFISRSTFRVIISIKEGIFLEGDAIFDATEEVPNEIALDYIAGLSRICARGIA